MRHVFPSISQNLVIWSSGVGCWLIIESRQSRGKGKRRTGNKSLHISKSLFIFQKSSGEIIPLFQKESNRNKQHFDIVQAKPDSLAQYFHDFPYNFYFLKVNNVLIFLYLIIYNLTIKKWYIYEHLPYKKLAWYGFFDEVQKYLSTAKSILLAQKQLNAEQKELVRNLSKNQKILITKLVKNINIICKMPKKEVVDFLKTAPAYQDILGELYFTPSINNYRFIVNERPSSQSVILLNNANPVYNLLVDQCYKVDYRIQFTISNISHKKVMKPVVCLIFKLNKSPQGQNSFCLYLSLEKFSDLRYKVAECMKNLFTVEMRTLY